MQFSFSKALTQYCMQMIGDSFFFPLTYYSVSCFSGSGVFLERWALGDVVKQRAYVGKGERLFFGGEWSATGAVLMNDNSWRDRQLK